MRVSAEPNGEAMVVIVGRAGSSSVFFLTDPPPTEVYTLSLHDALPISDPGATDRTNFATNQLVIITPPDDPAGIGSLLDLTRSGVQLVLAAEGVPVGDYAREA